MNKDIEYVGLDPYVEYIKIHGLQRSGTNYVSDLINNNLINTKAMVNLGGWKHGHYMAPWAVGKEVHVAVVVKNPYAWLVSVYNYWGPNRKLNIGPDLAGVSFEDFVMNKVYIEKQRDVPFIFRASNPVQHWNNMNYHWGSIRMNAKTLFLLSYEMTLHDPENVVKKMSEQFGVKKQDGFFSSDKTFVPSGENLNPSQDEFNRDYYMKNNFLKHYTPELLEFVNSELDLEVMIKFGYPIVQVEDLAQ